jgi:hypothetical protein
MLIKELTHLPKEDDLSDRLVHLFKYYPNLLIEFISQFIISNFPDSELIIISRSQFSNIPIQGIAKIGKKPDIILYNDKYFILFENKRDASLRADQLPSYIEAINEIRKEREVSYVFLAPRTSRYTNIPTEFNTITWDDVCNFYEARINLLNQSDRNIIQETFTRYRLKHFQNIFDKISESIRPHIKNITYSGNKDTSDYYSIHFTLPQTEEVIFSLGIFLQSPSYIKLFPFKVKYNNKLIKFNDNHPIINKYREDIFNKLPYTVHKLKRTYPGYVIDLLHSKSESVDDICNVIMKLLQSECQEMIRIYRSIS